MQWGRTKEKLTEILPLSQVTRLVTLTATHTYILIFYTCNAPNNAAPGFVYGFCMFVFETWLRVMAAYRYFICGGDSRCSKNMQVKEGRDLKQLKKQEGSIPIGQCYGL